MNLACSACPRGQVRELGRDRLVHPAGAGIVREDGSVAAPETRYARTEDGAHIAYQVVGSGPLDVVYANSFMGHVEVSWEYPPAAAFYERMAKFARLVLFDRRGTGLSDPFAGAFDIEDRTADLRAVMDALDLERPVLLGSSEGGMTCVQLAAMSPDRVAALVLFSTTARVLADEECPWAWSAASHDLFLDSIESSWGDPTGAGVAFLNPSLADDASACAWYARYFRLSASPSLARMLVEGTAKIDVRHLLSLVQVPTLVVHRTDEAWLRVEGSRYVASKIPGATLVELPGTDHYIWEQNSADVVDEIEEFVTGVRRDRDPLRSLKTMVFTDIVGSTSQAAALGDARWRQLLDRHEAVGRRQIERFGGTTVKPTGDGVLATFDSPARAIRAGLVLREAMRGLDLTLRIGIHAGEVELRGDDIGGIAVHVAARVQALAEPGQILVSRTVADLVAGSGINLTDRGEHELRGVPGTWRLFEVAS
jgi:class 3 adenylate cyclase